MNINRWIKPKGEILLCGFCLSPLAHNEDKFFALSGRAGYNCLQCIVPDIKKDDDSSISRYGIGVMYDIPSHADIIYDQVIFTETFLIHSHEDKWYSVHNNLLKEQTIIAMLEPTRQEHLYAGEKVAGLALVGKQVIFPFIDTWDLTDQQMTLSKIKSFLLFS